jgi:hypothetical protein
MFLPFLLLKYKMSNRYLPAKSANNVSGKKSGLIMRSLTVISSYAYVHENLNLKLTKEISET